MLNSNPKSPLELVTIVIPAYNYATYLPFAIESALAQTYPNVEVIVIDDGSTDHTPEVVQRYLPRIRCHRKLNGGLSAARNTGTALARGEFIVFLDADDLVKPDMVERCMHTVHNWPRPVDVVAGLTYAINKQGEVINATIPTPFAKDQEIPRQDIVVGTRFSVTCLVRKEALLRIRGFDENLRSTEDRDAWIRIAQDGCIVRLGHHLGASRSHGDNMSSHTERQTSTMRVVMRRALSQTHPWSKRLWLTLRAWSCYHWSSAQLFRNSGRPFKGLLRATYSIALWPWPNTLDIATMGGYKKPFFRLSYIAVTTCRILKSTLALTTSK